MRDTTTHMSAYSVKKDPPSLHEVIHKKTCFFLTSAPVLSALPDPLTPEVAFWGRSNVGKSSLLNVLMKSPSLARVSKTPGCTQAIHFYRSPPGLTLVDLPGYGYAKVPLSLKSRWYKLVTTYLSSRGALWTIYLLIDSRHPLQPSDRTALFFLQTLHKPFEVIFTKSDAPPRSLLSQHLALFEQEFPKIKYTCVSSKKKQGFDSLFSALAVFNPNSSSSSSL